MLHPLRTYSKGIKRHVFLFLFLISTLSKSFSQNAIVTENALPGNPYTEWGVTSSANFRNPNINGYATEISVNKGSTVHFKVSGQNGVPYTIKIYRLGYYNGLGACMKADLGSFTGIKQPTGVGDPATGLLDCSNWSETASWAIPASAVSGLYIAKLESTAGRNHIIFIVRDDASSSKVFFQTNDATWQAYNGFGGNFFYGGTTNFPNGHAVKVSYNRPFFLFNSGFAVDGRQSDWYMNDTYPMLRWLERNGYDMTYTTNVDVARSGNLLLNHRVFVTAGHHEYVSKEERDHIEAARNAGVHCAFFTGNDVYWKTRWETDASGKDFHNLVCYKEGTVAGGGESSCGFKCDVSSPVWTGLWRTGAAFDAPVPENALLGQISWDQPSGPGFGVPIKVPDTYKNLRFWRNTSVATLGAGQTAVLAPNTLGYEFDYEQFPDTYPNGRMTLSSTTLNGHTHKLSLYRYGGSNGPLVFGAGTIQWAWGLDDLHFGDSTKQVSKDMQQATLNLFADMGVQPGSMQSDLVAATASTDVTAPVSLISSPATGSTITSSTVTVTGTASDANTVAGVEVSVDGGVTWKLATGKTNWIFNWTPLTGGTYTIKCRGYDDTGNMEVPNSNGSNVITITINLTPPVCPCNIFTTQTPAQGTSNDGTPIELGIKFQSGIPGTITGVRFYKTSGNSGTHIGELYSSNGTRLAQATFINETATGWQTVAFSDPVSITANTTYVAAYFSSAGNFTNTSNYFTTSLINSPLIALASGTDGANAVYNYTTSPAFPVSFSGHVPNYWVDVVFTDRPVLPTANAGANQTITLPISSVTLDGSGSVLASSYLWSQVSGPGSANITSPSTVSTNVTGLVQGTYVFQLAINGGVSISQVTVTVNPIPPPTANAGTNQTIILPTSSVSLNGSGSTGIITSYLWTKVSGPNTPVITTPTAVSTTVTDLIQGTYVFQLSVNAGVSTSQVTVTVLAAGTTTTIFTTQTPADILFNDGAPLELGVKFRSSSSGFIQGIRFYKTTGNSGTHIGELYSSTGTRLAQATFTGETATGWQTVNFSAPVAITANTTYIAAYFSSAGNYTATVNFFTTAVINSPLTGLADGTDGSNGVYIYSATPAFPSSPSGSKANYWVDAIYSSNAAPTANAGANQTITLPTSSVTLNGNGSTGTITSYSWTMVSGPNTPVITTPTAVTTTVTGLIQGTYIFQLAINGGVSISQVTVTVNPIPPPTANAGTNQTITLPTSSVSLNGSGSTGIITSYLWTKVSGPNTPVITTPTTVSTTVTGLIQGTYVFQLSVNAGVSTSQVTVTVLAAGTTTTIFTTQAPANILFNDGASLELGVKFRSSSSGFIQGIRFYKTTGNSGTHIGELYSSTGTRLAQATFTGETATGWQTVNFSAPVAITANTTYIAAYFSSAGNYTATVNFFTTAVINSPLTGLADGTDGSNGVYIYSATPAFPSSPSGSKANYWVDAIYSSNAAPTANAGANQTITLPTSSATLNGNGSSGTITSYLWTKVSGPNTPVITTPNAVTTTVTGLIQGTYIFQLSVNGGVSTSQVTITVNPAPPPTANAGTNQTITLPTSSVTLNGNGSTGIITSYLWTKVSGPNTPVITTPAAVSTTVTGLIQGTYVFQLSVNAGVSTSQVTVTVLAAGTATTIFTTQTPADILFNDGAALELGVKFRSSIAGFIKGVRFFKTTGNTGTHIGELYSSTGTRLAQATFTGETATGWQTVVFSTPVAITANTTYIAAYFSSAGNYTASVNFFTTAVINSPLTALADGTDGANGVYIYSASPAFPSSPSGNKANYWVDAFFSTSSQAGLADGTPAQFVVVKPDEPTTENLSYSLGQNYPNPVYQQNTRIRYSIPVNGRVELVLYDIQGRLVKVLVNEIKSPGIYYYDLNTSVLGKGLYYYRMYSGNYSEVKKMVVP